MCSHKCLHRDDPISVSCEACEEYQPSAASAGYRDLWQALYDVSTGRIEHIYSGLCPDGVEGPDVRDEECPACRVLIEADKVLSR